jgi:RHS repeat-associated protein
MGDAGELSVRYDRAYAPFGEVYTELNNNTENRTFTGPQEDTTPGIDDFLMRQYSASQGRWLVPDPAGMAAVDITNPQTWNRYAYVANNPLNAVDPLGLHHYCLGQEVYGSGSPLCASDLDDMSGAAGVAGSYWVVSGITAGGNGVFFLLDAANNWVNTNNWDELDAVAADEIGIGEQGPNVPLGTPQNYVNLLNQAFKSALKDLKKKKRCGNFYGGQGASTLQATLYQFEDLGSSTVGAQTNSPTSVFINSAGPFVTYSPTPGQTGPFGVFWTQPQFGAFIPLHELGHQLSAITGFLPDAGPSNLSLNQSQSQQVLGVCF